LDGDMDFFGVEWRRKRDIIRLWII
jgi:hypothetical protein